MALKDLVILTKKDFINNFDLNILFSNYFFFYNINSFDLYFVGIKGFEDKKYSIDKIKENLKFIFKKKKLRKLLIFFYAKIVSESLRQNIFFFKKKLINKFLSKFKF